jgi:flagellar biosynthesis protein FliQ
MSGEFGMESMLAGLWETLTVAGPVLACVLAAAFVINLMQATTQLQDPSLAIIPRLLIGGVALLYLLPWMVDRLGEFTRETIQRVVSGVG